MYIKICGIKTLDDALAAVDAGADMLGFNFYSKSPRYINPDVCAKIMATLRERAISIVTVGVFVNASMKAISAVMKHCQLDRAQLSGDESPEMLFELGNMAFKAIRPKDGDEMIAYLRRYMACSRAPAYLVDAAVPGEYGGTGRVADWKMVYSLAKRMPILLAGGLTADNVASAIAQVKPWGVDVASGVESEPGGKDSQKIQEFVAAVRQTGA